MNPIHYAHWIHECLAFGCIWHLKLNEALPGREDAGRSNFPCRGILKFFCAWLIVMFPVVLGSEALYLLLVDDWSFGLKDPHTVGILTTIGFCLLVAQHLYRIVTLIALIRKKRFAVANARIYLTASLAMVVAFVIIVMDAWMILIPALAATVTWWLVLYQSKKVKAWES